MLAYLPKATVQAAIGGLPLAMGLPCGTIVLTVSVAAILITAPMGAFLIDLTYQRLLTAAVESSWRGKVTRGDWYREYEAMILYPYSKELMFAVLEKVEKITKNRRWNGTLLLQPYE